MNKKKTIDEKCRCHCEVAHTQELRCDFHCNPEKQGDWEREFDEKMEEYEPKGWWLYAGMDGDLDTEKVKQFIRQVEKQTRESVVEEFVNGLIEASRVGNEYHIEIIGEAVWGIREKLKQKTKE